MRLYDCCGSFPNDEASSIQVHQQCGVSVYRDAQFSGESANFLVGSHECMHDMSEFPNDAVSSMTVVDIPAVGSGH
eukprot:SAG22_NODE_2953_length_2079_cov_1.704545_2_plen_76_part_00